jgi:hypothetical protein
MRVGLPSARTVPVARWSARVAMHTRRRLPMPLLMVHLDLDRGGSMRACRPSAARPSAGR